MPDRTPAMAELLRLIRLHEGGKAGYNADLYNDDKWMLTNKTFDEFRALGRSQVTTGGARGGKEPSSALGGYQFLTATLDGLKKNLKLTGKEIMTPEFQDELAIALMRGRGLDGYLAGKITAEAFANNLAKEWASLPMVTGPKKGRSYYSGDGLNKSFHKPETILAAVRALKNEKPPASADLILRFGDGISVNQTAPYANAIKEAQQLLRAKGYYGGIVDGMFGRVTEEAVKLFQKDRRLAQDGVIGPMTWAALRTANPNSAVMGDGEPQPPAKETTPMEALSGRKTYIAVIIGGVIVLANAAGIEIPGVDLDKAAWLEQFWSLGIIATFRAALAKLLT